MKTIVLWLMMFVSVMPIQSAPALKSPIPSNGYLFVLPKDFDKQTLKGFKVTLEVVETEAKQPYFINVYSVGDAGLGNTKKINVYLSAVFKLLKKGERTIVYLEPPSEGAWWSDRELMIGYSVSSIYSPKVNLKIVSVELRLKDAARISD